MIAMMLAAATPTAAVSERVDLHWHPHVSVWLVFIALAAGLWWAISRVGPSQVAPGEPVITRRQRNWLVFGLGIAYIASEWPIHDISERYLLLVHMVQHTVYTLVAPAALLLGTPDWLLRWVTDRPVIRQVVRFWSLPLVALIVFNALIAGTHWPRIVESTLHSEWKHFGVHLALFSSALFMWMPVINRLPEYPRLNNPMKIMYLFAQSLVPMIPAAFLAFSNEALYPTYAAAPRLIGLDALGDQQIAAAIMKVGGTMLLWSVMAYVFLRWYQDSQAGFDDMRPRVAPRPPVPTPVVAAAVRPAAGGPAAVDDVLTWADVEAEFERIDSARGPRPDA
jgi:putative membrane protein